MQGSTNALTCDLLRVKDTAHDTSQAKFEGQAEALAERLSAQALAQRLKAAQTNRELTETAERLWTEKAEFALEQRQLEAMGASRQQRRASERREHKLTSRTLQLLERDDEGVREILAHAHRMDDIVEGSQPTDVDELLWFMLEALGLTEVLSEVAPPPTYFDEKKGKQVKRREMYPALVLNLLGVISRYMGLSSGPEIHARLLTDPRWMRLLGFTHEEVLFGATRRSIGLSGKTREGQGGSFEEAGELGPARARVEGARGGLSSQTPSEHESTLEAENLVRLFNTVVQAMARQGLLPKQVRGSLDSTGQEVVPSFEGTGKVRKKVKVLSRARRPHQVEVTVGRFKVWYLMDVSTGLPLGFALDTIEKPEKEHARMTMHDVVWLLGGEVMGVLPSR